MAGAQKGRPRRHKKTDRLLHPGATKAEQLVDAAVGRFDEWARYMDRRWGVDRLFQLVPIELAQRYAGALGVLNDAIREIDPQKAAEASANCIRGMQKLDEVATAEGHALARGDVIEVADDDGNVFGILLDEREWPAAKQARPDLDLVSPREVAIALHFHKHELVRKAKQEFPGAEVSGVKPAEPGEKLPNEFWENGGDVIEF